MRNSVILILCACSAMSCGTNLAARYEKGNRALSQGDGPMYSVIIAPVLQSALNTCIPRGMPNASRVIMMLADISPEGAASNVVVQPDSTGTDCVSEKISQARFRKPPLEPGQESFPIGLRIELAQ